MEFRTGYNSKVDEVSLATGVRCDVNPDTGEVLESMTQQQFRDEADINEIVRRFGLTGQLPDNLSMPVSGDFTGVSDFQSAMNLVLQAQEEFMKLPAPVRERFGNDPGKLMAFLDDASNRDEARNLGLLAPEPEKTRDVVQAVDELAARLVPKV